MYGYMYECMDACVYIHTVTQLHIYTERERERKQYHLRL